MRPQLTDAQAARFNRDNVLRYTGVAGSERVDPWSPKRVSMADITPHHIVGQGGRFETVQAAVDYIVAQGRTERVVIGIMPGIHAGLVYLPRIEQPVTLVGLGHRPSDTLLVANIDAEMPGSEYRRTFAQQFSTAPRQVRSIFERIAARPTITTANASVVRIEADDVQLVNLTLRNTYNADRAQVGLTKKNQAGQYATGQHQAVALLLAGGDRAQIQDVVLRSFQDTLYLQSPSKGTTVRTFLSGCDIEGDVDFIFGQATAWFERCTIRSLGTRAPQSWATAPSTDLRTPFGFVFDKCDFVHDGSPGAKASAFRLGRQWFEGVRATPYGTATLDGYRCDLGAVSAFFAPTGTISRETLHSVGKCVIMHSRLGRHIQPSAPWDVWGGSPWTLRYRPVQYRAGDMFELLSDWLQEQGIAYPDVAPGTVFLAEYRNSVA